MKTLKELGKEMDIFTLIKGYDSTLTGASRKCQVKAQQDVSTHPLEQLKLNNLTITGDGKDCWQDFKNGLAVPCKIKHRFTIHHPANPILGCYSREMKTFYKKSFLKVCFY